MEIDSVFLIGWLAASIRLATPIALTAIGGAFSERSGNLNIGLEGMMLVGAFTAVVVSFYTGSWFLGAICAMIAGAFLSLVHAYLTITRHAHQIISGVAINLLALGLTNTLARTTFSDIGRARVTGFPQVKIPLLGDIPYVGEIMFNQPVIVYVAYVLPFVFAWFMFRTTWGLAVRGSGDYPHAVDASGISVKWTRYLAVMLSGAMAGLGGAALSLGALRLFAPGGMTAGRGFIALAAIVFGRWNPILVALACVLFGAADALQLRAQTFGFGIPHEFFLMLPYILTIAALIGFMGRSRPPEHLARPYRPGTE